MTFITALMSVLKGVFILAFLVFLGWSIWKVVLKPLGLDKIFKKKVYISDEIYETVIRGIKEGKTFNEIVEPIVIPDKTSSDGVRIEGIGFSKMKPEEQKAYIEAYIQVANEMKGGEEQNRKQENKSINGESKWRKIFRRRK